MLNLNNGKSVSETKLLVAMSGGVDSSVVAAMLKNAGYNVIGVTLKLYSTSEARSEKSKACCGDTDIMDAKKVAIQIGIPHHVVDYESIFKHEVMEKFADDYLAGSTPIPCIRCNQSVKFRDLFKIAKDINADAMITGHYVRRLDGAKGAELHTALDETKDQSYFLFSTTQSQLDFLHFPLGGKTKSEVRKIAESFNLPVSNKKDSQDICFVPNGNYVSVIQKLRPGTLEEGPILHLTTQQKMGTHKGLINYTIGQRRGFGVAHSEALYVVKMDFETNTLYIGEESLLYNKNFIINEINILAEELFQDGTLDAEVCLRALQPKIPATITLLNNNHARIALKQEGRAITKGQACVIHLGSRIIGGGFIETVE